MEIYDRIRILRKEYLDISQSAFGQKLGVSRDVIKNIELNLLARPEQKEPIYKLICETFNVSEKWLKEGVGEVFVQDDTFSLDKFLEMKNATNLEKEIIQAYFSLPEDVRKEVINHFEEFFSKKDDDDIEEDDEIQRELEAYKLELQAERKAKTSEVSDVTDTKRKKA